MHDIWSYVKPFLRRFGKRVLLHILQNYEDTIPHILLDTLIAVMANSAELKYRTCGNIWSELDSLKINFSNPYYRVIQNTIGGVLIYM